MNNKKLRPNIVRGGVAIPIPNKKNYYYMKGRKHENGGIDIGKNPRTGLEVEDGEVMHISPTEVKVFSSVPFLNGESPAEKVIKGNNPNKVFKEQENYKDRNNINDDGTKNNQNRKNKSRYGTKKNSFEKIREIQGLMNNVSTLENPIISPEYTPNYDNTEVGKLINYSENPDSIGFDKSTRRWYAPKGKGLDKDNFGMGVDKYTGGDISDKIKKDSKGREYITEEDERDLRFKRIKSANQSAKRRIDFIRKYYNNEGNITETKEALLTNLIYNRGSGRTAREYFNPEDKKYVPLQKAILRGTDDEVREEINKIYKEAGLANRDSLINNFYEKRSKKRMGGLNRSKDYGSKSKPYPKVKNSDFAGKNRSYPIPTKADAIDALRLAGLHGRSDIRSKVYSRYPELRKKAKAGGIYSVTVNGKTTLHMNPSTGDWAKIKFDNRNKAKTGTKINYRNQPNLVKIKSPIENGEVPFELPKITTETINNNLSKIPSINTVTNDNDKNNFIDVNTKDILTNGIGVASNIIGGLISYNANKDMLNKLKYTTPPINRRAVKLKTNVNINPQLDAIREQTRQIEEQIDNNTASSRVALSRKQRVRNNAIRNINQLYSEKENIENNLINKDRLNQQTVTNKNIDEYNKWAENKTNFENLVREKKSENEISLINNINSGIQNTISNIQQRETFDNNVRAIAAGNPNVNPRILKALGIRGITDKMIEDWDKAYGKKYNK